MNWPAEHTAFVTGAASGIGLGISRALVEAGARVALADIDGDRLAGVAAGLTEAGGTVTTVELDVSDPDKWRSAAADAERTLGPVSILVNNAGVSGSGPIEQTPLELWRWVQRINLDAQFIGVSTFLPRFKERGGRAYILNTASMAGLVPMANVGAYTASKFGSVGFSMVLREELRSSEIGVSVLCPGTVATRLTATDQELQAKLLGREADAATAENNAAMLAHGADPDRVGEQVVAAMQRDQFLIITHGDWAPMVRRVQQEIEQTFTDFDDPNGPDPVPQALLSGKFSIS